MSELMDKVCPRADLPARLAALPRPLVFTNGVFDVLHRGHVNYLHQAAALGGSLIVAVNSDASARMLGKGPDRPLNRAEDRAAVLAGLASVALVTFFDERTPVELIQEIRPDLYVKGGDYDMEQLEETRVVRSWGGDALAIPFVDGYSTTALVKRIRAGDGTGDRAAAPRKAAFDMKRSACPVSIDSVKAISSARASIPSAMRCRILRRSAPETAAQPAKAAWAARAAASISAASPRATSAKGARSTGEMISKVLPETAGTA